MFITKKKFNLLMQQAREKGAEGEAQEHKFWQELAEKKMIELQANEQELREKRVELNGAKSDKRNILQDIDRLASKYAR